MLYAEMVLEYTENLFLRVVFRNAVVIVKPCLRTPTDMKDRIDMRLRPLHDLSDFLPIGDLLKGKIFDGRPCDDHAVILLMANFGKCTVKLGQIILRGMARPVGLRIDEINFDLQ